MKYIIVVPDGMADRPIEELGGKTPLSIAKKPNMDFIAKQGKVGIACTIPKGMPPASDVANISILGYDPSIYYTGRGPLEAANMGIALRENEVAFRCNLVTVSGSKLIDYSAGHISTKEAKELIKNIDKRLGNKDIRFYPGVSYRHLLVINTQDSLELCNIKCTPPHDIAGKHIKRYLPKGKGCKFLAQLMDESRRILDEHEINKVRTDLGENPANMLWLWGQGISPKIPSFYDTFHLKGSVISAVDLVKGIGRLIGLEVINVPGATGYYDTDYSAKARWGLRSLKDKDFLFIHIEAADEAGHNGDLREKIRAIENVDRLVIGPILEYFNNKDFRLMVLPDHVTSTYLRTHVTDPVCFAIYGKDVPSNGASIFNEYEAGKTGLRFDKGHNLMEYFINPK